MPKNSKKSYRRKQKMYNMKGCSKTRKNYLGGNVSTSSIPFLPSQNGGCGQCASGYMVGGAKHRAECKCSKCKKIRMGGQKGGTLSNFMTQDFINLGRQFQFGLGSAYNALAGYPSPVNPLPWKDQFQHQTPFNPALIQ
jgi:hypothetical protein